MERNEPREITARAGEFQGACCDTHDRSRSASTGSSATTAASLPPPRILPRSSSAPAGSPSYARSTKRRPPGRRQSALSASATASERGPLPPPVWRRQDQKPSGWRGFGNRKMRHALIPPRPARRQNATWSTHRFDLPGMVLSPRLMSRDKALACGERVRCRPHLRSSKGKLTFELRLW